jgi:acyl-CoA thioester hydrolase
MAADAGRIYSETTFRVRYAETDLMGVVHHSAYVVYMEEGRSDLGRKYNVSNAALERMGFSLAVSDLQVRYAASARYDDLITVRTWIEQVRSRGITFAYEVINAGSGQLLVSGRTRHICVDRAGQVCRLPEAWIAPLKPLIG